MTREKVLSTKPGRELDELVIRHIMNIPIVESVDLFSQEPFPAAGWVEDEGWYIADERDEDGLIYRTFNPSEDIAAAWEVVEGIDYLDVHKYKDRYVCAVYGKKTNHAQGKTVAEAICKAALLAVMDGGE